MPQEAQPREDRSLGQLFSALSADVSRLVREEIALARVETLAKARGLGPPIGLLAAGGLVAYIGLMVLAAMVVVLLSLQAGLPWWASTLIVGGVLALGGSALVATGLERVRNFDLAPRRTIETLKEDAKWAREQTT